MPIMILPLGNNGHSQVSVGFGCGTTHFLAQTGGRELSFRSDDVGNFDETGLGMQRAEGFNMKGELPMNRRDFLTLAAASTGYTAFVSLNGFGAESPGVSPHDAIAARFDEIVPLSPGAERFSAEPHMIVVDLKCDLLVAGGGMAGVCAAVAAARHGARVVLVQDRSRLGGNSSSEVKMHIVGADIHGSRPGWRVGGLMDE